MMAHDNTKTIKVLSVYRSRLVENRGTPLRVKKIIHYLISTKGFDVTTCSWDTAAVFPTKHILLTNEHWTDIKKIYQYVRGHDIDIVIGHTMATFYYLWPIKLFTKAKIVLEMHGFIEEEARLYKDISIFRYWASKVVYKLFYRWCDLITTCSDTATKILSRYNKRVVTLWGSVDMELFNPYIKSKKLIARDKIVIGYAGNSRIWQGVDFLLETYKELAEDNKKFKLAILTSERKEIIKLPGVEIYGPLRHNEVPAFLADCDILVIPRPDNIVNRISFPSKLIEYMAMGKPVVASKIGDTDCIITDGINGLLYEPGDKNGFKKALVKLEDMALRKQLGENAYHTIEKKFKKEQQATLLSKELQKLT